MALDMFLDLDGIKGESRDQAYKGKIDILDWKWGASNAGSAHVGGGIGSGKANFRDVVIRKYLDLSSAKLLESVSLGTHFKQAKIIVRKSGGKQSLEYCTVTLDEVMVTDYEFGGEGLRDVSATTGDGKFRETGARSGGQDRLEETVTLTFARFEVKYQAQDKAGSKAGDTKFAYNIAENAEG